MDAMIIRGKPPQAEYSAGFGNGAGVGYGDSHGYGYCDGNGAGDGDGAGDGVGYGAGYGAGDGAGYGYGTGDGAGDGYSNGEYWQATVDCFASTWPATFQKRLAALRKEGATIRAGVSRKIRKQTTM